MAAPPPPTYLGVMNARPLGLVAAAVLAAFTVLSLWVVAREGYFGFVTLAGREPWALQMLIDLVLALVVATAWMIRDARGRGIASWPFVVATIGLGSIGVLGYVVRRAMIREPA
jgi:hypothetical protein